MSLSISVIFTVVAILMVLNISVVPAAPGGERTWGVSDNLFVACFATAILLPTWVVHFLPSYHTPLCISVLAILLAVGVTPRLDGRYNYKASRFLWCTLLFIATIVSWITFMDRFMAGRLLRDGIGGA